MGLIHIKYVVCLPLKVCCCISILYLKALISFCPEMLWALESYEFLSRYNYSTIISEVP